MAPKLTARFGVPALNGPLTAFGLYLAGSVVLFHNTWAAPLDRLTGDGGSDVYVYLWFLRWTPFALTHGINPLHTDFMNWPQGVNVMWNGWMPAIALALYPVSQTLGLVFSYNLLVTLALPVSGFAAYLVTRRFTSNAWAALAGGALYAFSPYMLAHSLEHPILTLSPVPPLLLLLAHEIVLKRSRPPVLVGLAIGLIGAFEVFMVEEILAYAAVLLIPVAVALIYRHRRATRVALGYVAVALATAIAVFLPVVAVPLHSQFFGPGHVTGSIHAGNSIYEIDLLNLVLPTSVQALAPAWSVAVSRQFSGNILEWNGYLGVPLIIVLAWTIREHWSERAVRWLAATLAISLILSLGPRLRIGGHLQPVLLPFVFLIPMPVLKALQPNRIAVFTFLFAAVLVGYFVAGTVAARGPRVLLRGLLLAAVALTLLPTFGFPTTSAPDARFAPALASALPPRSVVLVAPYADPFDNRASYWQAASGPAFKMPEGYFLTGDPQGDFIDRAPATATSAELLEIRSGKAPDLTPELRAQVRADLRRWDATGVLVAPSEQSAALSRLFSYVLCAPPQQIAGALLWTTEGIADAASC